MTELKYGPNTIYVERLIERLQNLTTEEIARITTTVRGNTWSFAFNDTWRSARVLATEQARWHAEWDRLEYAFGRTTWYSLLATVDGAFLALLTRGYIPYEDYIALTEPLSAVIGPLHPDDAASAERVLYPDVVMRQEVETPVSEEVRATSTTGAQKGRKPEQFSLIPAPALFELSKHYAKGAEKYAAHNWRAGYPWSWSFDALQRHAWAWWNGEDLDPDTGSPHMAAVMFHAASLLTYIQEHPEFDDRPTK